MADSNLMVTGDSQEAVAYALMICIAQNAGKIYIGGATPLADADEKWVLETYAKCLKVVRA